MRSRKKIFAALVAAGLVLAGPALAADGDADARIRELEKKLERSLQMIEALQVKVQQMQPQAAPVAGAEQAAKIDALEKQVAQLGSGMSSRGGADDGLPIHGFADMGVRRSAEDNPVFGKGKKGFNVGSMDLYLSPNLGGNVKSLIELNFEVDQAGAVGTDLERLQGGYAFSDALTAWIGRFHTPYGYWNTAFHHGAQIQTSVLRPRFLDFEDKGGILPAHSTGAWATGTFNTDSARFGYDAYVANAQQINKDGVLDMKMAGGSSHGTSTGFNAWFSPKGLSALRLGLHGLRGTIETVDATPAVTAQTRLNMFGGYGAYIDDNWELLGEYYRFDNDDISGGSGKHKSSAWYTQAGYNVGQWTPFVRAEKTSLDQADKYFANQVSGRSYDRLSFGLRYELNPKTALKLELNRTKKRDLGVGVPDNSFSEAYAQFAVRF